ncbi:MAG: glycosyltransferase family 4 protein [Candidatus Binatus sp.]
MNLVFPRRIGLERVSVRERARFIKDWSKALASATLRRLMDRSPLPWMRIDPRIKLSFVPGLDSRFIPDADAVFATFWLTAEYVIKFPQAKGKKFYLIQGYEIWGGPKERVEATWRLSMHKVVVSNWLYDLGRTLGARPLRHIPNAVDHRHFRILDPSHARQLSILAIYHCQPIKGSQDSLSVFRLLHERHPGISISMFGPYRRGAEIPNWIQYFQNPSQDLIRDLYNQHAIYVGSSYSEGWALPPAEAMACGCAFVGTNIGGFRDYAINGLTALLSSPGDCNAMFENLCRVIENPELLSRLRKGGTEFIRQFTWEKSGALLEDYLHEVVDPDQRESAAAANVVV